jgi:hypothetical protein
MKADNKSSVELQIANLYHIDGILALQELYLVDNLSAEQKQAGFVTTRLTTDQLKDIIRKQGLFVAMDNDLLVAYIFAGDWDFYYQWPIFREMTSHFQDLAFKNFKINTTESFQYGPICIHENYRGTGLIKPFFEFMRKEMVTRFPLGLTFINMTNTPSLRAHTRRLNWEIIGKFEYNNNHYCILAYDMSEKQ